LNSLLSEFESELDSELSLSKLLQFVPSSFEIFLLLILVFLAFSLLESESESKSELELESTSASESELKFELNSVSLVSKSLFSLLR